MSRPQTTQHSQGEQVLSSTTGVPGAPQASAAEWLSALVDGECPDAQWPDPQAEGLRQSWMQFHLIGDALRTGGQAMPAPSSSFANSVMARVASEKPAWAVQTSTVSSPAVAAPEPLAAAPAAPAANDAVFRWKMLAGVASLAAVVAVAWQLTVAPSAALPGSAVGPEMASAPAAASLATAASQALLVAAPRDTVVSTEAGVLLRDPELEAFIAAHRQSGGMSALQMPAGFLRNATFEAPQR